MLLGVLVILAVLLAFQAPEFPVNDPIPERGMHLLSGKEMCVSNHAIDDNHLANSCAALTVNQGVLNERHAGLQIKRSSFQDFNVEVRFWRQRSYSGEQSRANFNDASWSFPLIATGKPDMRPSTMAPSPLSLHDKTLSRCPFDVKHDPCPLGGYGGIGAKFAVFGIPPVRPHGT